MNFGKIGGRRYALPYLFAAQLLLGTSLPVLAQSTPTLLFNELPDELASNIKAHLEILSQPCNTSQVRLKRLLTPAYAQAESALRALGYYQPEIKLLIKPGAECWVLDATVTPGEPVRLAEVLIQVEGNAGTQEVFGEILDSSPLVEGAILNHGDYEALKNDLSSTAADQGYFDARFDEAHIDVDLASNSANIKLRFAPGNRYRFGAIALEHDGRLSEALIHGLMPLEAGDPYSSGSLALLRKKLDDSQYFRQIRVLPRLSRNAGFEVPITVALEMRPRHAYSGGLGFTTDTGPRARAGYQNRFLNQRGHKVSVDTSVSSVRSLLDSNYTIPLRDAARQSLNFGLGYSTENNDSFESSRTKFESSLRTELDSGWRQSLFVEVQNDSYIVGQQEDVSFLTMPGISMSKTQADDLISPTHGWRLFAQVRGASENLVSDASFIQAYMSAKHILSIGQVRLLTRVEGGATLIDQTRSLPASLRYFAGGDQSIRGFVYRALGPVDSNGAVVGGRNLLAASAEIDFMVKPSWRVAVFTDAGNAFDSVGKFELRRSAGVGLRWVSPIGPVRIDLAHPFAADESFRLHITMGPDL